MIRTLVSLFTAVLLFEVAFGAAYVSTEALRGILYRESIERQVLLPGASLRTAQYFEDALSEAFGEAVLPERFAHSSERQPGMRRSELPEEAAFGRALSGILSAPWVENMRLIGLLFMKRLALLFTVLLFGAMRPSVFGSIGLLMTFGGLATVLLLAYPADLPFGLWALLPVLLGISLRTLIRSWHRF